MFATLSSFEILKFYKRNTKTTQIEKDRIHSVNTNVTEKVPGSRNIQRMNWFLKEMERDLLTKQNQKTIIRVLDIIQSDGKKLSD